MLLSYAMLHMPVIRDAVVTEYYSVRTVSLHEDVTRTQQNSVDGIPAPDVHTINSLNLATQSADFPSFDAPQDSEAQMEPALPLPVVTDDAKSRQTLIQPELHTHAVMAEESPIPAVVIWAPESSSAKEIVAPQPDKPTSAVTQPAWYPPNEELELSEISLAASDTPSNISPPPGNTSPLFASFPDAATMPPATSSPSDQQPTPTAVLSISDVRMADGTVTLPPVNETHSSQSGSIAGAQSNATAANAGQPENRGSLIFDVGELSQSAAVRESVEHITLPRNGKFGVIVVGSSVSDEYPEAQRIWSGRVAYTAFLHVGLSKNWILQYSLLRSADAAAGGSVQRIEAPWPYDIYRPDLVNSEWNADALMIHGILNRSGRFESLAVAFPAQFPRANSILNALRQWQFRPARQDGKEIAVEVVLIIPNQLD